MTSTTKCRHTVLPIAVVAALTGVAACGSSDSGKDGGGGDPLAALRPADKSADDADSVKIESTGDMGDLMSIKADGEVVIGGASGAYVKEHLQSVTPNQSVQLLLASGDVEKVGEEEVRGEQTTHYAGTVNVADIQEQNANLGEEMRAELEEQLKASGITTADIDLWINDDNLLVKEVERGDTANGELNSTVHYSDYGVDVSAEEPPASQTVDYMDLMNSLPTS